MSSIVYLKNKSSGKVYAYLNESVWNSTLKKCECKRKCLGYVDPVTGDIIPNKLHKKYTSSATVVSVGTPYLLKHVADECGLTAAIQTAFPNDWELVLTCCIYLLDAETPVLSRITNWSRDNDNPLGKQITTEMVSELISHIDENAMHLFFREWRDSQDSEVFYMSHTMSVPSYETKKDFIHFNGLPDVTVTPPTGLSVTYASKGNIPVSYSIWNSSPKNSSDLELRAKDKAWLNFGKISQVLDRDYCTDENIDSLFSGNVRFVISAPPEFYFAKDAINRVKGRIMSKENLKIIDGEQLFVMSFLNYWEGRKCYTHIYFSVDIAEREFSYFLDLIDGWYSELKNGFYIPSHDEVYKKYFNVRDTENGPVIEENGEAIMSYNDFAGYFVLVSNVIKDPAFAFSLYNQKLKTQKSFENIRNDEDRFTLGLHSNAEYRNRLFLNFISLILSARISKGVSSSPALRNMDTAEIFREMGFVKKISIPGNENTYYTSLTTVQMEILRVFGIDPGRFTTTVSHMRPE